jgi:hypothetical protein
MKEIVWIVQRRKFRDGSIKPYRILSHCKLIKQGASPHCQIRGRLRWVPDADSRFFNQDQLYKGSLGLKDEMIICTTEDVEEFIGENICLFLD